MEIISADSSVLPAIFQHCTISFDGAVLHKIGLMQWGLKHFLKSRKDGLSIETEWQLAFGKNT